MIPGWFGRVPLRLRIFFRGVFLLLAIATVTLALAELREEKRLSYQNYRAVFRKNAEQLTARLQHPAGQLALLNPTLPGAAATPLHPLLLPYSAIDFDDRAKAQQAAEMSGCLVQYPNHAQLCVSVGNNPATGGYIYIVGAFASGPLVPHELGDQDLTRAHRLSVAVSMRGRSYHWIAPLEADATQFTSGFRGRLTGFSADTPDQLPEHPDTGFRGWLWQDGRCLDVSVTAAPADCLRRSFFSVRLPVELFREEFHDNPRMVWPPRDLADIRVRVQAFAPGAGAPLFDSNQPGALAPFALADLRSQLVVGETLRIRRLGTTGATEILSLSHDDTSSARPSRILSGIVRRLSVEGADQPVEARSIITTPVGEYEVLLSGEYRGVDRGLALVAGRLSWFVATTLAAIFLAWLAIELRIIRRITLLTRRAASLKGSLQGGDGLQLDLQDLRGGDELGLLAGVLAELLQRVNEDARRERLRADQEKDMWHAVGHEIMAPLQSLAALHAAAGDPSQRYIERMRQAVRVLYGSASPSDAILSAPLQLHRLDVQAFLQTVAANASHAGIEDVQFDGVDGPLLAQAEEYAFEDVITHILANANRHRTPATPIRIGLRRLADAAEVRIFNHGAPIDERLLGRIFEYGVSDAGDATADGRRGQGLFVAKTYMAKMGGTVEARNADDGVEFVLTLAIA